MEENEAIFALLLNPKTEEIVQVVGNKESDAERIWVTTLDDRAVGSFRLECGSRAIENYAGIYHPEAQEFGKANGLMVYLGAALVASSWGYEGIFSDCNYRSSSAADFWDKLVARNFACRNLDYGEGGLDFLSADDAHKTYLVIAHAGHKVAPYQTPVDLAVRAKVNTRKAVEQMVEILNKGYGLDAVQAFVRRHDVLRLMGQLELPLKTKQNPIEGLSKRSKAILSSFQDL